MMATTADELEQYQAMDRERAVEEAEMARKKGLRRWNRLMAADEVREEAKEGFCFLFFFRFFVLNYRGWFFTFRFSTLILEFDTSLVLNLMGFWY